MAEETIGGYRLQNLMMTGQTSQVWEVVELSSHRHFAMKLLLPEHAKSQSHRRMLQHEASVGKKLSHPNTITIYKVDTKSKNPYFVMEFFPAGSLKLRLIRKQFDFVKERLHHILTKAATGFAYMNASGWVHRDVKPDNILVNSSGDVRIIDFALAKRIQKASFFDKFLRRKKTTAGTRSYMSPEQIRGEALDGKSDIYSFGASAYELVTGRPPFRSATNAGLLKKHLVEKPEAPHTLNDDVTEDLSNLIMRMLEKKKQDRPRDFHEVLMRIRETRLFKSQPNPTPEDDMGMM